MGASDSKGHDPFRDWIDQTGTGKLARIFKVSEATIFHWKAGRCDPRVDHMVKIRKLSRGSVSYIDIIDRKCRIDRKTGKRLGVK